MDIGHDQYVDVIALGQIHIGQNLRAFALLPRGFDDHDIIDNGLRHSAC